MAYCLGSYVTVFLLWSGLREYTVGMAFDFHDLWRLAPFFMFGVVAPWVVPSFRYAVPYHFFGMAMLFAAAHSATHFRTPPPRPSLGMPIVRVGLWAVVGLMTLHGLILFRTRDAGDVELQVHWLAVIFDSLAELLMVLGLVILACERIRDQMHANNQMLAEAQAELEKVARTDGLTGLLNRRAYEEWVAGRGHESGAGCLAVIDLNDLKQLNDNYLHAAGDAALKLVSRALVGKFRVTDPIFRIGGDEFIVVMPGGHAEEMESRLSAIDSELLSQRLPGLPQPYNLVVAWGTATFADGDDTKTAYQKADSAMYAQKHRRKLYPRYPDRNGSN
ncbi:GGDEF domain-containing protein [Limnoglobus roseus]|nr:GGDEF domain-containing protein [Limnoglobus roseus]